MTRHDPPWYRDGLRFECTGCGACCVTRGDCEYVFLNDADAESIAGYLGLTVNDFAERHCVGEDGVTWLEMPGAECVFLERRSRCRIYPVRPRQCSSWPFWTENISSERTWAEIVIALCPGAGRGPLFSADEIARIARDRDAWLGIDLANPAS